MDGRRTSGNVDDRRGRVSGKTLGIGGGIVGVIVMAAITLFREVASRMCWAVCLAVASPTVE